MPQKNATPSKQQQNVIKRAGLNPHAWVVLKNLNYSMIIRNRVTGDVKLIKKEEPI